MGTGFKGGAINYHSVSNNLPNLINKYKFKNGYFGERGSNIKVREIYCKDPYAESKKFYDQLAYGGKESTLESGNGVKTQMSDGTIILYREYTSSKDSPAVDIGIKYSSNNGVIKQQRIHFKKVNCNV